MRFEGGFSCCACGFHSLACQLLVTHTRVLVRLHRISIVDWDLGAFRTSAGGTKVHEWVMKGFPEDVHLKQLPHEQFWGVFEGTPTWAAPSTHLGYGPSVAGDFGSFGCASVTCMHLMLLQAQQMHFYAASQSVSFYVQCELFGLKS